MLAEEKVHDDGAQETAGSEHIAVSIVDGLGNEWREECDLETMLAGVHHSGGVQMSLTRKFQIQFEAEEIPAEEAVLANVSNIRVDQEDQSRPP